MFLFVRDRENGKRIRGGGKFVNLKEKERNQICFDCLQDIWPRRTSRFDNKYRDKWHKKHNEQCMSVNVTPCNQQQLH